MSPNGLPNLNGNTWDTFPAQCLAQNNELELLDEWVNGGSEQVASNGLTSTFLILRFWLILSQLDFFSRRHNREDDHSFLNSRLLGTSSCLSYNAKPRMWNINLFACGEEQEEMLKIRQRYEVTGKTGADFCSPTVGDVSMSPGKKGHLLNGQCQKIRH